MKRYKLSKKDNKIMQQEKEGLRKLREHKCKKGLHSKILFTVLHQCT